MSVSIRFLGAARYVTGSKHLIRFNDTSILLDCGMVQGPRKSSDRANRELPLEAASVDHVILSHAHIDHCGSLPRLVKLGFGGKIHCTEATGDLAPIMLFDSAKLQAQDAKYMRRKGIKNWEPPYEEQDVEETMTRIDGHAYNKPFELCKGVTVEFLEAGHILGSAQVLLKIQDGGRLVRILFTGDLGQKDMPILRDPEPLPECDVLITEGTYGNRNHDALPDRERTIENIVKEENADGGRIIVPAFAVGRTQNLLWFLRNLRAQKRIAGLPIWVDSPMGQRATKVMAKHADLFDKEARKVLDEGGSPFSFPGVKFVQSVDESKSLNDVKSGIIIASSGMCEGGRVVHHLKQSLGRKQDCVLIVGYQAHGTLGRRLVNGHKTVRMFGQVYDVKCNVRKMGGLSAHADHSGLMEHLRPGSKFVRHAFIVHSEWNAAAPMRDDLERMGYEHAEVPEQGSEYEV